jgi:AraC-like DNA-binding protein
MNFSSKFVQDIIKFAALHGCKENDFYELDALLKADLQDENSRIEAELVSKIWEMSVNFTQNFDLGIQLGEKFYFNANRVIHTMMQSSDTVLQAFENAIKYSALIANVFDNSLVYDKNTFSVIFESHPEWLNESYCAQKCTLDVTVTCVVKSMQMLTNENNYPVKIEFGMPKPKNLEMYYRVFKCPIKFDSDKTIVTFDKFHLAYKINGKDVELLQSLSEYANHKIDKLSKGRNSLADMTKKNIYKLANPTFPTLEDVANNLNIGARTFQRKLSEENITFSNIIDEIRKELCQKYLLKENRSIQDVCYLLGYSEPSAFIRAFRRWYGVSPSKYKKSSWMNT